jgi:hypothetical protein
MNIFIAKNGQRLGPLTIVDVKEKVAAGEISLGDLAWHEGSAGWARVCDMPQLINSIVPEIPVPHEPHSASASNTQSQIDTTIGTPPFLEPVQALFLESGSAPGNCEPGHAQTIADNSQPSQPQAPSQGRSDATDWLSRERSNQVLWVVVALLGIVGLFCGILLDQWGLLVLSGLIGLIVWAVTLKTESLFKFGNQRPGRAGVLLLLGGGLSFLVGIILAIGAFYLLMETGLQARVVYCGIAVAGLLRVGWKWMGLGWQGFRTMKGN